MGASSEELDSIKELIHFDHVYYKQEGGSAGTADVDMEDSPTTVAAGAVAAVSPEDIIFLSSASSPSSSTLSNCDPSSPASSVVEVEDTVVIIEDDSSPAHIDDSAPLNLDMVCAASSDVGQGACLSGETLSAASLTFRMVSSPSALSTETGYESAVSPLSDCSFREDNLFEESVWEDDPLSELFPALV